MIQVYQADAIEFMRLLPDASVDHDDLWKLARQQGKRFWSKVSVSENGCWLWTSALDKDGYGKFQITLPRGAKTKQKHVRAHRLAWELWFGPAPKDLVTLHDCDTPRCVNPLHLSFGTQTENREDCGRKGRNASGDRNGRRRHPERYPFGVKHHRAKLNPEMVREVRKLRSQGLGSWRIAKRFNVTQGAIDGVLRGKTWRHV